MRRRQEIEIANQLQVDEPTISREMAYLNQQAQESLQRHIHEVLPSEYQKCMVGMKRNLKHVLEVRDSASDPKTKLQARAIANDCYKNIMDLCTGGVICTQALQYVEKRTEQINTLQN